MLTEFIAIKRFTFIMLLFISYGIDIHFTQKFVMVSQLILHNIYGPQIINLPHPRVKIQKILKLHDSYLPITYNFFKALLKSKT